ncbi:MAG: HAD-IA family hydrolase [Deltaproteobacteria bacterium]|nr:HAD-IA family hydrolase [Deltaproteobacteria bacterium]
MKRAVVFDLDGTLVDTALDLAFGVNAALASLGRPPRTIEHVRSIVGHGVVSLLSRALDVAESDDLVHEAKKVFDVAYLEHVAVDSRPYPGVVEALEGLDSLGFLLGVATNKSRPFALPLLRAMGLPHLSAIACADECAVRKPNPAVLALACARLRVRPVTTLFVGDSPVDIETGRAFGSRVAGVTWGFQAQALGALGAPLMRTPAELLGFSRALLRDFDRA